MFKDHSTKFPNERKIKQVTCLALMMFLFPLFNPPILSFACCYRYNRRLLCYEQKEEGLQSREELQPVTSSEKKGTVAGAMAFIIGTSIGSGILAIPEKASPAVTLYSSLYISRV